MRIINLYNQNIINNYPITFESAKSRKLIAKLEQATSLKKIEITFDELERMYNEIGYDIIRKRGSHAVVPVTSELNISVTIPHNDKYVNTNDLKRFLLVKGGKFAEASRI